MESTATTALKKVEEIKAIEPATLNEIAGSYVPSRTVPTQTVTGSEAEAKAFIYQKESGNRTDSINKSSGACGLGQALPCSKLPCSLQDYECQDKWFTDYATRRYGNWVKAKEFWLAHKWW